MSLIDSMKSFQPARQQASTHSQSHGQRIRQYSYPSETNRIFLVRQVSLAESRMMNRSQEQFGHYGCGCFVGILLVVPLAMTIIGSIYMNDCPADYKIPIYLVVGGISGVLNAIFLFFCTGKAGIISLILKTFMFVWFILGSVWIFAIYEPVYLVLSNPRYCNKILYLFAFWITIFEYILLIILIVYVCILCSFQYL